MDRSCNSIVHNPCDIIYTDEPCMSTTSAYLHNKITEDTDGHKEINQENKKRRLLPWKSRRRLVINSLHSSNITKYYEELAKKKLEIVETEQAQSESARVIKMEREEIEFNLRRKSLELDIMMKEAYLRRINKDKQLPLLFNV